MANLIEFDGSIEDLCAAQENISACPSTQPAFTFNVKISRLIDCDISFSGLTPTKQPDNAEDLDSSDVGGQEHVSGQEHVGEQEHVGGQEYVGGQEQCASERELRSLDCATKESDTHQENIKPDSTSTDNVQESVRLGEDKTTCSEDPADLLRLCKKWDNYLGTELAEAHLRDRVIFFEGFFSGNVLLQATLSNCFSTYEMWGRVFDYTRGRNLDEYVAKDDRGRRIMKRNNEVSRLYSAQGSIRPEKFVEWVLNNVQYGIPMIVSSNMKDFFSEDGKKFLNFCVRTEMSRDAVCECGKYPVAMKNDNFMCNEHARNLKSYEGVLLYLPLLINIKTNRSDTELCCFNYPTQFAARRNIRLPWSPEAVRKWTIVKSAHHPKPILDASRCGRQLELHNILHKPSKDIPVGSCFEIWEMNNGGTVSTIHKVKCIVQRLVFK